jgi:hypothetical protein
MPTYVLEERDFGRRGCLSAAALKGPAFGSFIGIGIGGYFEVTTAVKARGKYDVE